MDAGTFSDKSDRGPLPRILEKLAGSAPAEPGRALRPRRILVVDDDRDGVASLAILLSMMGHEICTACDGLEAVSAAEKFQPHIVLLDLNLPKMDGYGVCQRIRAGSRGNALMIVAVTGWSDDEHRMQALAAGFDMHLVKPVSAETFMTVLAAAP